MYLCFLRFWNSDYLPKQHYSFELHNGVCDWNVKSFWMLLVSSYQRFKESWPSDPKVKQYKAVQVEMFDPKDEGTMNVRKVRKYLPTNKSQCPTRLEYPAKPLKEPQISNETVSLCCRLWRFTRVLSRHISFSTVYSGGAFFKPRWGLSWLKFLVDFL